MSTQLLWGFEPPSALRDIVSYSWFPSNAPVAYRGCSEPPDSKWLDLVLSERWQGVMAEWQTAFGGVVVWPSLYSVKLQIPDQSLDEALKASIVAEIVVASFGAVLNWRADLKKLPRKYSLDGNLPVNGVAMLFKHEGHNRLVSRRWLDHGPWARCMVFSADLSVVFFHDPGEASAKQALEFAYPGHARMGVGLTCSVSSDHPLLESHLEVGLAFLPESRARVDLGSCVAA